MAPPARRTSTASAKPGPSQNPPKSRTPREYSRYVLLPGSTIIPTVMHSDRDHTLFSRGWWAEITKKDDFWKEFEKYVSRTTFDRRFKSPEGSKQVKLVTTLRTRQSKPRVQAGSHSGKGTVQVTVKGEDEMDDQEDVGDDPEERKPSLNDNLHVKPSIQVVIEPYSPISARSTAIKRQPTTGSVVLGTPYFTAAPLFLPSASPPPDKTPAAAPPQSYPGSASLKRKYDVRDIDSESEPEDTTVPATIQREAEDNIIPPATSGTIKQEIDADANTSSYSLYTVNLLAAATATTPTKTNRNQKTTLNLADDEVTFLRAISKRTVKANVKTERDKENDEDLNPRPPKKMLKLEEDSAEYLAFPKSSAMRSRTGISAGTGANANANGNASPTVKAETGWTGVKIED